MTEETTTTETTTSSDSLITDQPAALDFANGRPETFPAEFWDEEKKAPALDRLFNSYTQEKRRAEGLRVKLSKGEFEGKAPEDIKEYTLELSDELKPLVPEGDPLMEAAKLSAKEAGLPKEAFAKFITPIVAKLAELKGNIQEPTPEEIEADRLAKIEKLGPSGQRIVDNVGAFIKQMQASGTFSEAEAAAAKSMVFDADSARVMNKLRMMAGVKDEVPMDLPVDGSASRSDIETKMAKAMLDNNEEEYKKYSNLLARMR